MANTAEPPSSEPGESPEEWLKFAVSVIQICAGFALGYFAHWLTVRRERGSKARRWRSDALQTATLLRLDMQRERQSGDWMESFQIAIAKFATLAADPPNGFDVNEIRPIIEIMNRMCLMDLSEVAGDGGQKANQEAERLVGLLRKIGD